MKKILIAVLALCLGITGTASAYHFYYDIGEGYSFDDVEEGTYYYDAVYNMSSLGVIKGYGTPVNGYISFGPNDPVTRAQLATMLNRYHQHILELNQEVEYLKTIVCTGIDQNISSNSDYTNAYDEICFPGDPWDSPAVIE